LTFYFTNTGDTEQGVLYIDNNLVGSCGGDAFVAFNDHHSAASYIRNNVGNPADAYTIKSGKSVTAPTTENNEWDISKSAFGVTDWDGDDFTLTSAASVYLIDAGRSNGAPDHDYAETERPHGYGYDIGAYEY